MYIQLLYKVMQDKIKLESIIVFPTKGVCPDDFTAAFKSKLDIGPTSFRPWRIDFILNTFPAFASLCISGGSIEGC